MSAISSFSENAKMRAGPATPTAATDNTNTQAPITPRDAGHYVTTQVIERNTISDWIVAAMSRTSKSLWTRFDEDLSECDSER